MIFSPIRTIAGKHTKQTNAMAAIGHSSILLLIDGDSSYSALSDAPCGCWQVLMLSSSSLMLGGGEHIYSNVSRSIDVSLFGLPLRQGLGYR